MKKLECILLTIWLLIIPTIAFGCMCVLLLYFFTDLYYVIDENIMKPLLFTSFILAAIWVGILLIDSLIISPIRYFRKKLEEKE